MASHQQMAHLKIVPGSCRHGKETWCTPSSGLATSLSQSSTRASTADSTHTLPLRSPAYNDTKQKPCPPQRRHSHH
ncbi:hypothetical protein CIB84_014783 [Bambusicola thoracicus]|uniref:Uncharacterized protein n=1 Tax=Bambusicola thoracicus TaxID=9083 RepID=A0A2P4SBJ1_BAMTH|nr:hypothetical protein CIB84_014783 [Bambusicola thoracicus]